MKKLIVMLILIIGLSSCASNVRIEDSSDPYIVYKIRSMFDGTYSKYFALSDGDSMYMMSEITFYSKNGKFDIGDTVLVSVNTPDKKNLVVSN